MRQILIDWLVDVHLKFKLRCETLYITIDLIDRYMQRKVVHRQYFQLLGVSAMFVASKYEEIYPPMLKDFVQVCDYAYSKEQILIMESQILQVIDFELARNSPMSFLSLFCREFGLDDRCYCLTRYLCEISLMDAEYLSHSSLELSAGALWLIFKLLKKDVGSEDFERKTGVAEARAKAAGKLIYAIMQKVE